jgi:F-type H+-transporting ATPase subunit g
MILHPESHTDIITGLVPKATYYGRVGLELGKLIAHQRSMQPP